MRKLIVCLLLLAACKKHEAAAPAASTTASTSSTTSTTTAATTTTLPSHDGENLVALGSGAIPVIRGRAPEQGGEAYYMFDEDPTTGWASDDGGHWGDPTVVELPDRSVVKSVEFDEAKIAYDGRLPHEVLVEMSDTSATAGFQPIARVTMTEMKDGQSFPVSAEVPGRWVRVTVTKAASDAAIAGIQEFRAFGQRLTHNAAPNVTGTYEVTDGGKFYLKQTGTSVTGCYDRGTEALNGGMEGRILKFRIAYGENGSGPALLVFGSDGTMFGGWWRTDSAVTEHPTLSPIEGKRISTDVATTSCPQWSPAQQLGDDLKKNGRVTLYGINFDSDSDVIRSESKPTLDLVASVLKANGDMKVTVEGHTDATSTPEHNQDLSTRRANAVKQYLVGAGIDASRLDAAGFGATKPVATNDNALGRAANRRVELARK